MIIQPIIDLASVCAIKGITNVILSPGSRCAPLTLAFARHPQIKVRTITDERAAGFIALGMAQELGQTVAIVCTSGSAAMNYFPAVAEAYFQQVPLLILTADRPTEWIDQYDGQTVFQQGIYGNHVKKSFQFPDSFESTDQVWHANRIINEAINQSIQYPKGPVHINIPLREPFYPNAGEEINFPSEPRIVQLDEYSQVLSNSSLATLSKAFEKFSRILIIPGQQKPDLEIQKVLDQLSIEKNVVVVTDCISNLQSAATISLHDHWLGNSDLFEALNPDLILTFGKSIISKSLKLFARKSSAKHWHIQVDGSGKDTFQNLSRIIQSSPIQILENLLQTLPKQDEGFYSKWATLQFKAKNSLRKNLNSAPFGEYRALQQVSQIIPENSKIHVANSMSVRYLNFLGSWKQEIYCNRGTSGIDGSNSTAVGCTFITDQFVTLITGDLAFFYDRNAFWHNYPMPNLRIILLNNHAGGIFRLIEGPANQPELEEFFETKQSLTGDHLANEFGFGYQLVRNQEELIHALEDFYETSLSPKILEIETLSTENANILNQIKAAIKVDLTAQ